jgi:hypothetical protein
MLNQMAHFESSVYLRPVPEIVVVEDIAQLNVRSLLQGGFESVQPMNRNHSVDDEVASTGAGSCDLFERFCKFPQGHALTGGNSVDEIGEVERPHRPQEPIKEKFEVRLEGNKVEFV